MLLHNSYIPIAEEELDFEGFSDPRYRKVGRELIACWKTHKEVDVAKLLLQTEEEDIKNLISELLLEEERVIDSDRMFQDCLRKMKISRVLQEIHRVDEEIRQRSRQAKQSSAGTSGLKELLKRKQRLMVERKKWMGKNSVGEPLHGGMMPGKG
jgi:hypothetical protein